MGCGGSTNGNLSPDKEGGRRGSIFRKEPKVTIRIGDGVKVLNRKPRVIFVFGGPGTRKGKIIDNLSHVFDFELVVVENVILEELATKVENPEPNKITAQIRQMLQTQPELLRLDAVVKAICKKLQGLNQDRLYVVDFMPNLKWLLSNTCFIKDCTNEFRVLEEKFPISFVINFVLPKDEALKQVEEENLSTKTLISNADKQKGQSDEADKSRTQKRLTIYEQSVKGFLEYFKKVDKIVQIDVTCGIQEIIWSKVCDFFTDLSFEAKQIPETIIVFGFDTADLEKLNIGRYSLTVLTLADMASDPMAPVEQIIEALCKFVDNSDPTRKVFAVDMSGTSLTRELNKKRERKGILFHDNHEDCTMEKYCSVSITKKDVPVEMQAMATVENEICLFRKDVSPELCKWIASMIRANRQKRMVNQS